MDSDDGQERQGVCRVYKVSSSRVARASMGPSVGCPVSSCSPILFLDRGDAFRLAPPPDGPPTVVRAGRFQRFADSHASLASPCHEVLGEIENTEMWRATFGDKAMAAHRPDLAVRTLNEGLNHSRRRHVMRHENTCLHFALFAGGEMHDNSGCSLCSIPNLYRVCVSNQSCTHMSTAASLHHHVPVAVRTRRRSSFSTSSSPSSCRFWYFFWL